MASEDTATDGGPAGEEPLVDRIQAVYDQGLERVGGWIAGADAFAKAKPWAAVALALVAGWLFGGLGGRSRLRPVPAARRRR